MRKVIRKISAAIVATTITVAMCATCFAGTTFGGDFGQRENLYEGADGSLSGATASSFSADMDAIGWGGVWGGNIQPYLQELRIEASVGWYRWSDLFHRIADRYLARRRYGSVEVVPGFDRSSIPCSALLEGKTFQQG